MSSGPSKLVALFALLLCVWGVTYWLYNPGFDPNGAPITTGKAPTGLEGLGGAPSLAAVDQSPSEPPTGEMTPPPAIVIDPRTVVVQVPAPEPVTKKVVVAPEFTRYTVQKGDVSFEVIAKRVLGDRKYAAAISRANPMLSPDKLIAGRTVLNIPKDPTNIQGKETTITVPAKKPGANEAKPTEASTVGRTYTVLADDTLSGIAKKFYGKSAQWKKIFDANRGVISDPAKLKAGVQIVIPD